MTALSVLDLAPIAQGETPADALAMLGGARGAA